MGPLSPIAQEEPVEIRRQEALSHVKWLDKLLQRVDLASKLQLLLYQAGLSWTIGRLLMTSLLAGVIGGYLVYFRTGVLVLALFFMGLACCLPPPSQ